MPVPCACATARDYSDIELPVVKVPFEPLTVGKRHVDTSSGLEMMCAKGGRRPLTVAGRMLTLKATTP